MLTTIRLRRSMLLAAISFSASAGAAAAQDTLSTAMRASIDSTANAVLQRTGAPSASLAVVTHGRIVYANAYGQARIDPPLAASTAMRYSIGSISKQFTAACILLLAERGKLSLDDKVSRWLPDLTRANEVTIRQVLSMTSGYQDFWPQDYVMPPMLKSTTARAIVDGWAKKPLDFEPGSKWQYSNTNYVIAGMIIEKASGMPMMAFLRQNILTPLHISSATNTDSAGLSMSDPGRYLRYALGPAREAPKEGQGWMFSAGELAMTASDLARWDISVIKESLLKRASYREQQTDVRLTNGLATGYGLGVQVGSNSGHRMIYHTGEVSGFTAFNGIFPDDSIAIVVFTNMDATPASSQIGGAIANALFSTTDKEGEAATAQAKQIFEGLQKGTIDRSLFTDNANAYFSDQALADFASSLGALGPVSDITMTRQALRGGMTYRGFRVRCGNRTVTVSTFVMPDGKLEQYQVAS